MAQIPYQKSYGAHPGFLNSVFQAADPNTQEPIIQLGRGVQPTHYESESYGGIPHAGFPKVEASEFHHVPRHTIHNGNRILVNKNRPNRGPFLTPKLSDPQFQQKILKLNARKAGEVFTFEDGSKKAPSGGTWWERR